jgi:hypothetical protein
MFTTTTTSTTIGTEFVSQPANLAPSPSEASVSDRPFVSGDWTWFCHLTRLFAQSAWFKPLDSSLDHLQRLHSADSNASITSLLAQHQSDEKIQKLARFFNQLLPSRQWFMQASFAAVGPLVGKPYVYSVLF